MKAIYLAKKGGTNSLVSGEIQQPNPNPGQILVKVHAASVMPTEIQWNPTFQTESGSPRPFPIVLGHEFSGVVEGHGLNTGRFSDGEEVFGINDWFSNGA